MGCLREILGCVLVFSATHLAVAADPPLVVLIAVDTLRADRMAGAGYTRNTSPEMDALLDRGVRFTEARTVEPLTGPAMTTVMTGLPPHRHGVTRNGMSVASEMVALPSVLGERGWATSAIVGNWTLRPEICGLGEYFDSYQAVLTRRRWFGIFNREATAEDVTDNALQWLNSHRAAHPEQPTFLWVHYVEPHAPYRFHKEYSGRLGLPVSAQKPSRSDRYDTEVAAVDAEVGRLVDAVSELWPRPPLFVFVSDHGESLGEHGAWGHGRDLFEPGMRIPIGFVWEGVVQPGELHGPTSIIDVAPTIFGLLGVAEPESMEGLNHAVQVRRGGGAASQDRILCIQAHRGAVHGEHDEDRARSKGLLAVGVVVGNRKEIVRLGQHKLKVYDLEQDPAERRAVDGEVDRFSDELMACYGEVTEALGRLDKLAVKKLDEESLERLRALGYLE